MTELGPRPPAKGRSGWRPAAPRLCKREGCGVEFWPTGPRQVYHDPDCQRAALAERPKPATANGSGRPSALEGELPSGPVDRLDQRSRQGQGTPLGQAFIRVIRLAREEQRAPHLRDALDQVRRAEDDEQLATALAALAADALLELAHVGLEGFPVLSLGPPQARGWGELKRFDQLLPGDLVRVERE